MKVSFSKLVCLFAISAMLAMNGSSAAFHGSATGNPNRVTQNAQFFPANMAKAFAWDLDPTNQTANGYPATTPSADIGGPNPAMPSNYWSTFDWSWTGQGSMELTGSPPMIISNGGTAILGLGTNTGTVPGGNVIIQGQTNPHLTFLWGFNIQGIAASPTAPLIRISTPTGYASNIPNNSIVNITGAASNTNANGIWTVTVIDAQTIDLQGSTFAASAGVGGQSVITANNLHFYFHSVGTFSNMDNLIFCETANYTAIQGGQLSDPLYISQLKTLLNQNGASISNRGFIRFMDQSNVQASYEWDFANRRPVNYVSWSNQYFPPNYWGGTIASADGKNFTVSNPPASGVGAYADSEVVQGKFSASNTDLEPTLNVGGRGVAPVYDYSTNRIIWNVTAPPPSAGLVLQWQFSAAWLNGGTPYTFSYTTVSGDTGSVGTFNGNLGNAMVNDATLTAAKIAFGNSGHLSALWRSAEAGDMTITYLSSGTWSNTSMERLPASSMLSGQNGTFIYNKLLAGWIFRGSNQGFAVSAPLELIVEMANQTGSNVWYNWPIYTQPSYITQVTQFFADPITGLGSGQKFATEVGNEMWNTFQSPFGRSQFMASAAVGITNTGGEAFEWNWDALRTMQYAQYSIPAWTGKGRAKSDHYILLIGRQAEPNIGSNFDTNGLKAQYLNTSNPIYAAYGGFGTVTPVDYSAVGNRPADNITATGFADYWFGDWIRENTSEISGTVANNATWLQASLDYANGSTVSAFAAMTSMFTTQIASAPIQSGTYNSGTGVLSITLTQPLNSSFAPSVGDLIYVWFPQGTGTIGFMAGNVGFSAVSPTSGTTISLNVGTGRAAFTLNGGNAVDRTASGIDPNQGSNFQAFVWYYQQFETNLASYDAGRASGGTPLGTASGSPLGNLHYEAASQWSVGAGGATNGTGSAWYTDLANRITALGWNVSAYTKSGTNSATEAANQVVNLIQGWKNDLTNSGAAANTSSYNIMIKTNVYTALVNASKNGNVMKREVKPAQYGYDGSTSTWTYFPGSYTAQNPYQNFNATSEFDAGN